MRSVNRGVRQVARGLRTGRQPAIYLGALLWALARWRASRGGRRLVFRRLLRPGESLAIRVAPRGSERLEIIDPARRRQTR
jgi:hypothetical protein